MTAGERGGEGRVLAVTDLGPGGLAAIRAAAERARATGGVLAVVHVMPPLDRVRPLFPQHLAADALSQVELPRLVRGAVDRQLAEAAPEAQAEVILAEGGDAEQVLRVADEWRADLIAVGGAVDTPGIDAERIVRHAHVPVLVVRDGPDRGPILACTDFSDPALPAVHAAAREAARTGEPLIVAHALEPVPHAMVGIEGIGLIPSREWELERRKNAEERLAAALAQLEVAGEYVAVEGPVVSALVGLARERAARWMVIGTIGRTGLTRFLLGSVAEGLVRHAPCPTMVVRLHRDG